MLVTIDKIPIFDPLKEIIKLMTYEKTFTLSIHCPFGCKHGAG